MLLISPLTTGLAAIAPAFLLTFILHLGVLKWFPRLGLLDFPERYGLTRAALPYPSGVAAVIAFLVLAPLMLASSAQTTGLLLSVVLVAVTSVIDDRNGLPPRLRIGVQVLVGVIIYLAGARIYSITNPLQPWTDFAVIPLDRFVIVSQMFSNPSIIGIAFTVIWFLLTINSLNWLDGIPGQTSILATIGSLTIGVLASSDRAYQPDLALFAFTVAGIALATTFFDLPRKSVLGDTGSMFFGFMLGVLTIFAGGKVATAFLVLGVPLIDSMLVILRRLVAGRSPLKGSASGEHLHHRLLEAGWKPGSVIALNVVIGITFGGTALFLSTFEKFVAVLLLGLLMLLLSVLADIQRRATRRSASAH